MSGRNIFVTDALAGEVAVVTGGATGIGYAIARDFAMCGADVVIASRTAERLESAELKLTQETGRPCASLPCDVRNEADIDRLVDFVTARFGQATIVVNNAAANFPFRTETMGKRAMEVVVDTDLYGTLLVTRAFVPAMIERRAGCVLNITLSAPELGFPGYAHSGAAKAGIVSLTSSWAHEWGRYGIRVNAIGPGPIPTEGVASNMLGLSAEAQPFSWALRAIPLQRLGRPDDVSAAAVFLCSPAAGWITGLNLVIDGGYRLTPAVFDE
jgi:NAD(P)-dependent dehydrogenase (short-subunit alcohol dehydrogenase family)